MLHRLVGRGRLSLKRFVNRITITIEWKDWVDWNSMRQQMTQIETEQQQWGEQYVTKKLEQYETSKEPVKNSSTYGQGESLAATDEDTSAATGEHENDDYEHEYGQEENSSEYDKEIGQGQEQEQEYKQRESGFSSANELAMKEENDSPAFFGIPIIGRKQNKQSLQQQLSNPSWLLWLLVGQSAAQEKKRPSMKGQLKPDHPTAIVQRFLGVNNKLSGAKLEKELMKKLRAKGFHSVQQCYIFLLTEIVAILYEKAIVQKQAEYITMLELLGLFSSSSNLDKQQLAARLAMNATI
ncbi:hypothetical protein [Paenibacillus yanchengensis]|uniref:hypothetical protein n=1 Tax=Paenibacillus yanchengensis TaxID=2035833 RepID=UPI0036725E09